MKPLLDDDADLDARLRTALEAGRSDDPTSPAIDRLSEKLGAQLGIVIPPIAAAAPVPIAAKVVATAKLGKWLAVAALATAAATGGVYTVTRPAPSPHVPVPVPVPDSALVPAPAPSPLPAPDPTPSSSSPVPPAPPPDPRAEYALVARAQDALAHQRWKDALALTSEHQRRFPAGEHAEERERIAIEATWMSGRQAEARSRAQRFYARYPRTVYRGRLQELMGAAP